MSLDVLPTPHFAEFRCSRLPPSSVAVVLGTRPETVKLAGLVNLLGAAASVIHTGQHFDPELAGKVGSGTGMPLAQLQLSVGGGSRGRQIGEGVTGVDAWLARHEVRSVVVQGDTNATLAGALAANARGIPLVHVEAGLRSRDRSMPEEHNRILVDHLSDVLCAATELNADNLTREGIPGHRVFVTGNTVVEAVRRNLPTDADRQRVTASHRVGINGYVLATVHRPENTDDPAVLRRILTELGRLPCPVVLPLHPRTLAAVDRHGLSGLLAPLRPSSPLPPRDFLALASGAAVVVSDSGGMQEECTVLGRPLVVVRRSTERPEAMTDFARLVTPRQIATAVTECLARVPGLYDQLRSLPSPFGDGRASTRIARLVHRAAGCACAAAQLPAERTGPHLPVTAPRGAAPHPPDLASA
ncbi:UDP-N-acetylglucosamine 2-epimerase (non-hydrolyzing) [Streptomyces sp. HNM0574]|uniref:non-hydrolyzing UDP-N-acetylglucosamine 2-epimerase n=1 Tax=Streptomyces sp. HNM0574 TaxID=2714954 RepID=UPI00146C009E|nr:UDP-N-acetylglucosamine 2-epimerase (non-hydrolyzing) [Streptomyces sp. HNM0574]NLU70502.1 UDP-N-acetylglucosamine 2-epimerase (non-hydrolyzing) [Streptomyces sp. HNM0574]